MAYLGIFGFEFEKKTIVLLKIIILKIVKNECLTNTVNFVTGQLFLKVQGPLFVEV